MSKTLARNIRIAVAAGALTLAFVGTGAEASAPPGGGNLSPAATALTNPRGFVWDDAGNLVVALAGSGGPNAPTEDTPTNEFVGPWMGGTTGAVASIDPATGCPSALATGLASTIGASGEVLGAEDVAYLDGELYVGVDGGGAGHGNEDVPSGIYRVTGDGGAELVADLSAWTRENPVANIPPDSDPDAAGYSIVAEPSSGTLWVGDPNSGQILSVAADGAITQVLDFSEGHLVPTHLTLDPEGGVYFGILTVFPFTDGGAGVFHLGLDGAVEAVWTGLTTVVDVAVGEDGTLYALELSTGNTPESPLNPGSGRIVRQTGPDTNEVVVDSLNFPIAMEIGPDGVFYVATPGIGSNDGSGSIARFDPNTPPADATMPEGTVGESAACAPIAETIFEPTPDMSAPPPPPDVSTPPDVSAAPGG